MSKEVKKIKLKSNSFPGFSFIKEREGIYEYQLKKNGLTVLYKNFPNSGVVTTNITYKVGSRDEGLGETGLAHMLEHMLFKPTKEDLRKRKDSGAMLFERETGCILNANTWRDRTTYFFSYPAQYLQRALSIEAERMTNVVLSDKEFQPERNNVLSEFDMYFGDPKFALSVSMGSAAFQSHPYGHETIGFREDIENYTVEKLEKFYRLYYRPDNATLMLMGDIELETALKEVADSFGHLDSPKETIRRYKIFEPKQEGIRRVEISRDSSTNIISIGFKHPGYPTNEWLETMVLLEILAGDEDSIFHKLLVDTGIVSSLEYFIEPSSETSLGGVTLTLAKGVKHTEIEETVLKKISQLSEESIKRGLKKVIASIESQEAFRRDGSLKTAMSLTEDVAAGDWTTFFDTANNLKKVTPKKVVSRAKQLFKKQNLTIGYFIGNK